MFYVALVVATVATFAAYRALQATKSGSASSARRVVVAATDIHEGTTVAPTMLKVVQLPANAVAADAFAAPDSLIGRITRVPIFAGDVIVPGRLAPQGSGPGLEVKISPGMRAMAVKVDDVAGLSGLIQPGSHVDVLVTLRADNTMDRQVAKLFMENVRVLSVGSVVQRDNNGKPIEASTAALEVDPAQAERLAVAMHQGTIQLVLRGYGDPERVMTSGASSADVLEQLRSASATPPKAAAPAPTRSRRNDNATRSQRAAPSRDDTPARPRQSSDTSVVRVYRGSGQMTEKKFVNPDSTRHRPNGR